MLINDGIKKIADDFGIELTKENFQKLHNVLFNIKHGVGSVFVINKENDNMEFLQKSLESIAFSHGVNPQRMKIKCKEDRIVSAKAHFVRHVKTERPRVTFMDIASVLNVTNHTTVMHLLYSTKIECPIPPFPHPKYRRRNAA